MEYDEIIERLSLTLKGWEKHNRTHSIYFVKSEGDTFNMFSVSFFGRNPPESITFSVYIEEKSRYGDFTWSYTTELEDTFADPLNVTETEATLFKLENGFNYPEELVNDS